MPLIGCPAVFFDPKMFASGLTGQSLRTSSSAAILTISFLSFTFAG